MERIIALDPGGTTGWASWSDYEDESVKKFDSGQIGPHEHHKELYLLLHGVAWGTDLTVVTERFEYRNNSRAGLNLMSREYIGVTKLFTESMQNATLCLQTAAQAKGFVSDDRLKRLGLWSSGNKHANDALRHLLYYIINVSVLPIRDELLRVGWK